MVDADNCPFCDPEKYDGAKMRKIKNIQTGIRWSPGGPSRSNVGKDFYCCCCVIM